MKRGKPLRRTSIKRTRMKSGKRKTKYAQRERDLDYCLWVKTLPCLLSGPRLLEMEHGPDKDPGSCSGVVEADHAGDRGMGQKAPDDTCIPLCSGHHCDRHACTGFFGKREDETYAELKQRKRDWRHEAIANTQRLHREGGVISVEF